MLDISRTGYYYKPSSISEEQLQLINKVDEVYTAFPFFGTRKMAYYLQRNGCDVGRKKIRRVYEILGLEAIYPKPNLSRTNIEHPKYPYLLRDIEIVANNQVWSSDITYIRLYGGHVYLMVIMDWFSRYVLDWELSISLEADFCIETLGRLLSKKTCGIFNTDMGSQFTCHGFINLLLQNKIKISMDGKGRCLDNVFVERLWRSLKYECIYLLSLKDITEARRAIEKYFIFYNNERPHQSLAYKTPAEIYYS